MDIFQFGNFEFEITKGLVTVKKDGKKMNEFRFVENVCNSLVIPFSETQDFHLISKGHDEENQIGSILGDFIIVLVDLEGNEPIYAEVIYLIDFKKEQQVA